MPMVVKKSRLSAKETNQIKSIKNLTPGDFAVVQEQYVVENPSVITHNRLIESLKNEVRYKEAEKRVIGFRN